MATSHFSLQRRRSLAVLDIETTLDPAAAAIAAHRKGSLPTALQRVTTACLLVIDEDPSGAWRTPALHTLAAPLSEFELLMRLDGLLADVADRDGLLVTYNGMAHDLPIIRRRCLRHWMFGLPGLAAAAAIDHLDLMLRQSSGRRDRAPTLREACAALGISAADPRTDTGASLPPDVIKCQSDVVATFLLALFEMAYERGSEDVLVSGWEALASHLGGLRPRAMHLEHFRNHPSLRAARRSRIDQGEVG